MDYRKIPVDVQFAPKDKRDYTLEKFASVGVPLTSNFPDEYEIPYITPILNQGYTSMCLDFTYRSIEEEQHLALTGEYEEYANGFMYGQKLFPIWEGMIEKYDVLTYVKVGLPLKADFNVVGTAMECKDYFDKYATSDIKSKAQLHANRAYVTVDNPDDVIKGLIKFGSSGCIGIEVYDSFYNTGGDGIVAPHSGNLVGGHAMKLKGVVRIDGRRYYKLQNSWTVNFGKGGYVFIACDDPIITVLRLFVDATPDNEVIELSIGDRVVKTLKGDLMMDVEPFIINNRTYVPLRFVSSVLGFKVAWLAYSGTKGLGKITINKDI